MDSSKLIDECLAGVIFESWLRFQFLEECENSVILKIPAAWLQEISRLAPALQKIASSLNNKPPTLEAARAAILEYMAEILNMNANGNKSPKDILENGDFQKKLENYHAWLASHEKALPLMEFPAWLKEFSKTNNT